MTLVISHSHVDLPLKLPLTAAFLNWVFSGKGIPLHFPEGVGGPVGQLCVGGRCMFELPWRLEPVAGSKGPCVVHIFTTLSTLAEGLLQSWGTS